MADPPTPGSTPEPTSEQFPAQETVATGNKAKARPKKAKVAVPTGHATGSTVVTTPGSGNFAAGLPTGGVVDIATKVAIIRGQIAQGLNPDLTTLYGTIDATGQRVPGSGAMVTPGKLNVGDITYSGKPRTVEGVLNDFARWTPDEFKVMQQKLYAAGYFQAEYYMHPEKHPVAYGVKNDQATRSAFALMLSDGLLFKDKTLDQILTENAQANAPILAQLGVAAHVHQGVVGGGGVQSVTVDDPATTRTLADSVATAVLGRVLNDADKAKYVKLVEAHETQAQKALNDAQEQARRKMFGIQAANARAADAGQSSGDVYVAPINVKTTQVDPRADLEEGIRKDNAQEAGAHDAGKAYQGFSEVWGRPFA